LQRSAKLGPLKPEISFMTNLQNIKQGLKSDYSDKQILDLLLVNLSFTDELINQHLGLSKTAGGAKLLERDPTAFREFVK
jgi:hypothetical protein